MAGSKDYNVERTETPYGVPERSKKVGDKEVKVPWAPGRQPILVRMLKSSKRHKVGDVCGLPPSVAEGYVKTQSAEYVKPKSK